MSQSIAILIGNTKYNDLSELACCFNDVHQIRDLLSATQKFSQILEFIDRPISNFREEIHKLAEFKDEYDEVFFYFSGHGLSNADDFFMCFEEFKESAPNSSGLSRSDAYELVRMFGAKQSVFVIDSCEAGRNIIKSDERALTRALKPAFTNFVQFSSCTEAQSSLAGDQVSLFTNEFIKACLQKADGPIYYSDVENGLRDAFLNHPEQTPHFIKQGTSKEKFCVDASRLKLFRENYSPSIEQQNEEQEEETKAEPTIVLAKAAIEHIDSQVPSKTDAQTFIDGVFNAGLNQPDNTKEIGGFFDIRTVKYDHFDNVQNLKAVINLLDRRGGSDSFVESDVERKKRRSPFGALGYAALAGLGTADDYDTTYNLFNRCELEAVHVGIYFEPKYMALNRVFSEVVFLPRLTECLILTCNSKERRSGWKSFNECEGTKKWGWSHHSWSDDPTEVAQRYVSDPYDYAKEYVLSFGKTTN